MMRNEFKSRTARAALRRRALSAVAIAALSIALGGCKTAREVVVDDYPNDYRQRHPVVIQERNKTTQLFVGTRRGELTAAQRATAASFAGEWRREATGGVVIEVPSGTPNERAANDAAREARSILMSSGVPEHAINMVPYKPADPAKFATIRLNYPRVAADAGPCGLWPDDLGPSNFRNHAQNREYWNLGCANQRNLAAMVADPSDLVQPRGEVPPYTARRTMVLDKYRKGEATQTTDPNAGKGKISDVGQ